MILTEFPDKLCLVAWQSVNSTESVKKTIGMPATVRTNSMRDGWLKISWDEPTYRALAECGKEAAPDVLRGNPGLTVECTSPYHARPSYWDKDGDYCCPACFTKND